MATGEVKRGVAPRGAVMLQQDMEVALVSRLVPPSRVQGLKFLFCSNCFMCGSMPPCH